MRPRYPWRLSPSVATALGLLLLLGFAAVSEALVHGLLAGFDRVVIAWSLAIQNAPLTTLMRGLTSLGSAWVLIPLALLTAAWVWGTPLRRPPGPGRRLARYSALIVLAVLTGSWLFNSLLKFIFHRARPDIFPLVAASGFSYPSGHSMSTMAFYSAAAYIVTLTLVAARRASGPDDRHPLLLGIAAAVVILLVGYSRIYLGVHYPSDVLGGYLAGGAWALFCLAGLESLARH